MFPEVQKMVNDVAINSIHATILRGNIFMQCIFGTPFSPYLCFDPAMGNTILFLG